MQTGGKTTSTALPGRRAELVFAFLAVEHRRVVTRDELADALWPDELPVAWAGGLRGVVSEVRRFLADAGLAPDEVLASAEGGYIMRLPDGVSIDLDVARDAIGLAEDRLTAGDPAAAVAPATSAVALTEPRFLPTHEGTWVDGVRRDVEVLHRRALAATARARGRVGDTLGAAAAAERLCRADPFDESSHQLRIRILGEAGDRAGARLAYQQCASLLREELGVEPSAETEAALKEALGQAPPATSAGEPAHPERHGLSVLVVEDHDFQRETAAVLLRSMGISTVLEASNGAEALEVLARTPPPDVILCDVDMPGMDGVEFVRRIAGLGLASSVVLTSALDAPVLRAVEQLTAGYGLTLLGSLEKPLTTRRLAEVLDRHLGVRRHGEVVTDPSGAAAELRRSLAAGRVATMSEPVINLATGRTFQGLIRPALASPPVALPDDVVDTAMLDSEQAVDLLVTLVSAAAEAATGWSSDGFKLTTCVRLPARATADVSLVDRLASGAGTIGAPGVIIRVDEAAVRRDLTLALDVLTRLRLRGYGVSLQLSNVGGSREVISGLPITEIHLDDRLLSGAGSSPRQLALLEAAVDRARTAQVPVVAGGCDSQADFEALLSVGCDGAHGRHIAPPMATGDVVDWTRRWETRRSAVS